VEAAEERVSEAETEVVSDITAEELQDPTRPPITVVPLPPLQSEIEFPHDKDYFSGILKSRHIYIYIYGQKSKKEKQREILLLSLQYYSYRTLLQT